MPSSDRVVALCSGKAPERLLCICHLESGAALIGSHSANFLPRNFLFGAEPVFRLMALFPAARFVEVVGTAADLFCKVRIRLGGYLRLRHCVQIFRHGTLLSSCGVGRGPTREGRT